MILRSANLHLKVQINLRFCCHLMHQVKILDVVVMFWFKAGV